MIGNNARTAPSLSSVLTYSPIRDGC